MNDFEKIANHYVPKDFTVKYRKSLSGNCCYNLKLIQAPRPVTAKSLYIFLHECAHAYLHGVGSGTPRHVEEMEAELWAQAKLAKHGIEVPADLVLRGRRYVARKIMQAERRGAKRIDPRARAYAGEEFIQEYHTRWEAVLGKSKHPNAAKAAEVD
jgi:hypothetical protein